MSSSSYSNGHWDEFVNNSGQEIPPFAVMKCTGVVVVEPGRVALMMDQPDAFGCWGQCFYNNLVSVADGNYGAAGRSNVMAMLYDSGDGTPAYGDMWGPQSGTWKLKKNTGGFFCLGPPTNTSLSIALFAPRPMTDFYGKNTGSRITKGSTGTINIFTGSPGAETDSGQTMANVLARFGDIPASAMVQCRLNETVSNSVPQWYVVQEDVCP